MTNRTVLLGASIAVGFVTCVVVMVSEVLQAIDSRVRAARVDAGQPITLRNNERLDLAGSKLLSIRADEGIEWAYVTPEAIHQVVFADPRGQYRRVEFRPRAGYVAAEDGGWVAHGMRCEP